MSAPIQEIADMQLQLQEILQEYTYQEAAESNNNEVPQINIFDAINFVPFAREPPYIEVRLCLLNYFRHVKYRKILCVNRIRAYQEAAENNNNEVPQINIFDAINFVSDAWNQATTEIIKNSWKKTNIIINQNTTDLMVEDQSEINEINSLITQLPFQDRLNANEYVTIDQNLL
ncbi:11833_t:CDS:2, partial [Entrophospora sp. SA101]